MSAKILVFAGSTRTGSLNAKLAGILSDALKKKGADADHIDLTDYTLPLFNADLEMPENAMALAQRFAGCDGFAIVSPEYNASLTPLLKNTLDWVSVTRRDGDPGFEPYKDKVCFLASCSPGAIGGLRGLYHLRAVLMNVGAQILTTQLALGNGGTAFRDDGGLVEPRMVDLMEKGLDELLFTVKRIKAVPRG